MLKVTELTRPGILPISFEIGTGECVALTGPSGAGKTLLLRAIADLDVNDGEVEADGLIRSESAAPLWRQHVMYVAAESGWWMDTVGEHYVAIDEVLPLLESLLMPADCVTWPVVQLSTGEKQRLSLARALALHPQVLLLDEPTAALDQRSADAVEGLIGGQLAAGVSVLLVTHDMDMARSLATRVLRMDRGHLVEDGV